MASLRKPVVAQLHKLFKLHDKHEMRLVKRIRREGAAPAIMFHEHNQLERDIIYAMADATDAEIKAAESGL
jgi:hypothetical protein